MSQQEPSKDEAPIIDIDTSCRACLNTNGCVDLFSYEHNGVVLSKIFISLTLLKLDKQDGMPCHLCQVCTRLVEKFHLFQEKAKQTEAILIEYKDKVKPIQEDQNAAVDTSDENFDDFVNLSEEVELKLTKVLTKRTKNLTCTFCSRNFASYADYKEHRKKEADLRRKKFPCKICKKMIGKYKLKDHINSHTKERPYQCQLCGEKFRFRSSLTRHNFIHMEKKPHQCHICGKGFIQAPTLTDHLRIHTGEKSFVCNICGKCFVTKHTLANHVNLHRKEQADVMLDDNLTCKQCDKTFKTKIVLKKHLYVHGDKEFLCSQCGKKFSTKALLDSHFKVHSGIRPYVCLVCNKAFSQKNSLKKHELTHTGEKHISCIVCDKRFSQKSHLIYHMRRHSGERPYTCSYCDKTFNHTGSLKVHIRIHTGEKPFVCDVCSKGFYDSSSMKKHRKVHNDAKVGGTLLNDAVVDQTRLISEKQVAAK